MREGCKTGFARQLRRNMTDAERRLWYQLRDRRLLGWKFRRQAPIGPYIADFACVEAGLVVEVDGGQHDPAMDAGRTRFLEARGFTTLRFWNNDVLTRTDAVLEAICAALPGPHPNPSPACGRGA